MLVMLFVLGASAANLIYQYIPGYLFDRYGVVCFMYIEIQNSISLLGVFCIMLLVARKHGRRFRHDGKSTSCDYDGASEEEKKDAFLDEIDEKQVEHSV